MDRNPLRDFLLVAATACAGFALSEGLNHNAKTSQAPAPTAPNVLTVTNSNGKVVASVINSATGEKYICLPSDVPAYDQTCRTVSNFKPRTNA
jgi:hypothetical protein